VNAISSDVAAGFETVFTSHLAATLSTMAREGHGLAWLPLTTIREDLASARLVRAGEGHVDISVEIRLFHSTEREPPIQ
jgi:LysR family transcriptional regulator, hypochlorite-specific transcription factor HypT